MNSGLNVFNRRSIRSYEARSISEPDLRRIYVSEEDEAGNSAVVATEATV